MLPLPIASLLHFFLEALAALLAFRYFLYLRKQGSDQIEEQNRMYIIIAAAFGALLGSRLLGSLEVPSLFFNGGGSIGILYYWRSKTIVGALLGGLWSVELAKRLMGEKKRSGDLFVYPLLLAMIIGRVGCFLMGVHEATHGILTDSFLGMDLGDGLKRHPTALYEIFFLAILWFFLRQWEQSKDRKPGLLFMLFMVVYLSYRLLVGFIQPKVEILLGLGAIQLACLLGLTYYFFEIRAETRLKEED